MSRSTGKLSPKLQKIRAAKIVERKIMTAKNNVQLAKEFQVTEGAIRRALALAEKAEIVVKFEDKLYQELLPEAYEAVRSGLDGSGDVARAKLGVQIMTGTQILRPAQAKTVAQQHDDDELAMYVLKKRKEAALLANTIDGDFNALAESTNQANFEGESPGNLLLSPGPPETDQAGSALDSQEGVENAETASEEDFLAGD
jgi:hypothetical protein